MIGKCRQYFISHCNLFDHFDYVPLSDINLAIATFSSVTHESLSFWLIENYVRVCAQLCPDTIAKTMNNIRTAQQLQIVLSAIVNWKVAFYDQLSVYHFNQILITGATLKRGIHLAHLHAFRRFIEASQEEDGRLFDFFIALVFLHSTELMTQGRGIFEIVNVLHDLMQMSVFKTKSRSSSTSTAFTKAITNLLMQLETGINTDTMLQVELGKAFFHMSISNTDVHPAHEDGLARVYLASLYQSSGQYQTALEQFILAAKSSEIQGISHVVESQLLPANDDIRSVSGLIVLYDFIKRSGVVNQQEIKHFPVFDAELF